MDLTLVCAGVIAFGVLLYVVLDGFDLGIGILFPFMPSRAAQDLAVHSIEPVWDGNETWLILGGAVLFAAFPKAYAVALSAFYIPVMLLLFALIFRGVAFEFRLKAQRSKAFWNAAFYLGSTTAAFAQGLLLGALLQGVELVNGEFGGGAWDWLSPFSIVSGLGVVGGYALLGATWLNMKSSGEIQQWARMAARRCLLITLMFLAVVSIYTPLEFPAVAERWFSGMNALLLAPVPLSTAVVAASLWRELDHGAERMPFFYAIALFMLGYLGIGISLWPHILPPAMSIWDAAAPLKSQQFLLVAVAAALPMVLIYTAYAYWVFRGKAEQGAGYSGH